MTMRRWRALSFDLDGTLVDTGDEIATAANRALDDLGLAALDRASVLRHVGRGGRALMRALLVERDAGGVDLDAAHARFDARYGEIAGSLSRPYEGAADALERLRDAGLRLACVTNKSERFARRVLEATGLAARLDLVVGGDTLAVRKPDAAVLRHALSVFACPARSMAHVGDSGTDIEAARAADVAAWAVPWGFDGGTPVAECDPDRVFVSFAGIVDAALTEPDG